MHSVPYFHALVLASATIGILAACKAQQNRSKTESVDVPVATEKKVKETGFRWAYGATDFLQAEHKKRTGEQVNLSEEALGFYRISENLSRIFKTNADSVDAIDAVTCLGFYGLQSQTFGSSESLNGFELGAKYGVVTEEAYPTKFISMTQQTETFQGILERVKLLLSEKKPALISVEDIQQKIILRPDATKSSRSAFNSVPPSSFDFLGKKWEAKEFFSKHLTDVTNPYKLMNFSSPGEFGKMISLVKKTLASGYAVPFDLGVDRRLVSDITGHSIFTGKTFVTNIPAVKKFKSVDSCSINQASFPQAYHSSLIVDFVNKGSKEGSFESETQLAREVNKAGSELEYIKIRNQFGIDDLAGSAWPIPSDGHFLIDQEYLLASLKNGVTLRILVPKTVADDVK